jgi:hypothetical protein
MESQEILERVVRTSSPAMQEVATVTSPGARAGAWTVQVKSLASYNVYNVSIVVLGGPGSLPSEIGQETQAINLAEPFLEQGTLAVGTFGIMFRVCDKNVFYVQP